MSFAVVQESWEELMGKLLNIARQVIERQNNPARQRHTLAAPHEEVEAPSAPEDAYTSNDIDDRNDQRVPSDGAAQGVEPRRFLPTPESFDNFACSGHVYRVWVDALDECVLFAADNAPPTDGLFSAGYAVYDATDLRALVGATPDNFRLWHELYKAFGVKIGDTELDDP